MCSRHDQTLQIDSYVHHPVVYRGLKTRQCIFIFVPSQRMAGKQSCILL